MQTLTRDQYKAIKHMDKAALVAYLSRVYQRGFEDGRNMPKPVRTAKKAAELTENGDSPPIED